LEVPIITLPLRTLSQKLRRVAGGGGIRFTRSIPANDIDIPLMVAPRERDGNPACFFRVGGPQWDLSEGHPEGRAMDWIRVSCASLCRIEYQNSYLLLVNQNRREKGIYVLSPIGGALAVHDPGPLERLGAVFEGPENHDLRLGLPREAIPAFREWFYGGEGREQSPYRELVEELVVETGLLAALPPEAVECTYLRSAEEQAPTQRSGQTGLMTHYFLEIYDVKFRTASTLGPLLVPPPGSGAVWVTEAQIRARSRIALFLDGEERSVWINGLLLLEPPASA
jgi:hypothetical protein